MGKTSKPLNIMIHESLMGCHEIEELLSKGHKRTGSPMDPAPDLILAPMAWRMTPDLLKYLPLAVKAAREVKYPKKKGENDA